MRRSVVRNSNLICPLLTSFELLIKRLRTLFTAFFASMKWLKRLSTEISIQITYILLQGNIVVSFGLFKFECLSQYERVVLKSLLLGSLIAG